MDFLTVLLMLSIAPYVKSSRLLEADKRTYFNVETYGAIGDGKTDSTQAFLKAWGDMCRALGTPTIVVPREKTFLLKPLQFNGPCKAPNVQVQVLGNIVAPDSMGAWNGLDLNKWIVFSQVNGLTVFGTGQIDGRGSVWWRHACSYNDKKMDDWIGKDADGCTIPSALGFEGCNGVQLSGLTHVNSPRAHISIASCSNVTLSNLHIFAPENSPNTDGVDISNSKNIHIQDSNIGTGDDCVAINGGCSYINITNVACGPGHGISVGSLGRNGAHDIVEVVNVKNCNFSGTMNGARIKTWQGGSGYARKISFEEIKLIEVQNPIIIDQYYCDREHDCHNQSSAVQVSDVTYTRFHGSAANEEAINLSCSASVACTNIVMDNINIISTVPNNRTYSYCINAHGKSSSSTPDVPCLN